MTLEELKKAAEQHGYALSALRNISGNDAMSEGEREVINSVIDDLDEKIRQRPKMSNTESIDDKKKREFQNQYEDAFLKYLRNGRDFDLVKLLRNNTTFGVNSNGFALSSSMNAIISSTMIKNSPFRQLARIINVSRDNLDVASYVQDIVAGWGDERTVAPETDAFSRKNIKVNDLTAQPKITQKMIDDDAIDHESWIAELLSDIFLAEEDNAFLYGDGDNKPVGILSYKDGTDANCIERVKGGSDVTFENLLQLQAALDGKYERLGETSFITSKKTLAKIRSIKDDSGRYIWTPGAMSGKYDCIFGTPILSTSEMGSENDVVIYGNLKKGYQIVDRSDIKIQRDPYSSKPFVIFYATKRVGGDVIDTRAIKVLSIG